MKETRLYKSWGEKDGKEINAVSFGNGILCAKRALNDFHKNLSRQGYNQVTLTVISIFLVLQINNQSLKVNYLKLLDFCHSSMLRLLNGKNITNKAKEETNTFLIKD